MGETIAHIFRCYDHHQAQRENERAVAWPTNTRSISHLLFLIFFFFLFLSGTHIRYLAGESAWRLSRGSASPRPSGYFENRRWQPMAQVPPPIFQLARQLWNIVWCLYETGVEWSLLILLLSSIFIFRNNARHPVNKLVTQLWDNRIKWVQFKGQHLQHYARL